MKGGIIKSVIAIVCIALGASSAFATGGEHTNLRVIQTQTSLIRHKGKRDRVLARYSRKPLTLLEKRTLGRLESSGCSIS